MARPSKKKYPGQHSHNKSTPEKSFDDLLWGINPVLESLSHHPRGLREILVQKGKAGSRLQEVIDTARKANVRVRFVEPERMGAPRGCKHQGVVARQSEAECIPLTELLDYATNHAGRILILDSIQDPRNLGSILRSALAAGFGAVIITRERSAPLSGTVAKTSAGAISRIKICQIVNLADTLKELKEHGYWIFGTVVEPGAKSVYTTDFSGKIGLVIGSEGKGIRPLVKKQCDHLITIPMATDFDSLNASVAAALVMFEVARQQPDQA
jgi:23S rRNA (guanosine2251-2'-O)-methyltransferase